MVKPSPRQTQIRQRAAFATIFAATVLLGALSLHAAESDGVFVRFKLAEPAGANVYFTLGGYIHGEPWYLPGASIPAGAEKKGGARVAAGEYCEWFDVKAFAGKRLHGKMNRVGGVAEFPNVTVKCSVEPAELLRVRGGRMVLETELATAADAGKIVKRWREEIVGDSTSFLVSPNLAADAAELENASEMTARRMKWALDATGGTRHAPKELILQTSFWSPQRMELNAREAKIVSLLGFNVVGNLPAELRKDFPEFRLPFASHDVLLGPQVSADEIHAKWEKLTGKEKPQAGAPFNFQDEICARPPIGTNETALRNFHEWLAKEKLDPAALGAATLDEVVPIETPLVLRERMKTNEAAARRVFYYTSRFRQWAATESLLMNTTEFHRRFGVGPIATTLLADHPVFSGTGLGMGMEEPNGAWGGWPLAMDWFDVGRRRAVDMIGVEDWMGLQFMYGPNYTWEGFQLMGYQAAMFRSANRDLPVIAWITPSDERNLRLKAASSLCQGAKNFFYWTYGPTATSTENYWSDQKGSYPGMAHLSRMLEFGERILALGKPRAGRVALLYSVSSDLWQPFNYVHLLERRALYLALIHAQYLVDMVSEEDVASGRLNGYRVLYSADPCISSAATKAIGEWVRAGGILVGTCAAGSRNEFGEAAAELAGVFGIEPSIVEERQPGHYRTRGKLNDIAPLDRMKIGAAELEFVGVKINAKAAGAKVTGTFAKDGAPAIFEHRYGKGRAIYFAGTPGVGYIKAAKFVAEDLKEKWPADYRGALTRYAHEAGALPLVKLSHAVVEAGIYDAPKGTALVLANFTYEPIAALKVEVPVRQRIARVKALEGGALSFETFVAPAEWKAEGFEFVVRFEVKLGVDELVVMEGE